LSRKDLPVCHPPSCGSCVACSHQCDSLSFQQYLHYRIIYANMCTTASTCWYSTALQDIFLKSNCSGSAKQRHQFVQVIGLSKFHMTVHNAHTVWGYSAWLLLAPVGACVSSLIWIMLPACQCCSSSLVLCCAAMILLEPAVRPILWSKSIHSLILGLSIAPFVQLLHQDILTQNRCILLITTLHDHLHNQQKQCWGSELALPDVQASFVTVMQ